MTLGQLSERHDLATNVQRLERSAAIHVIRYDHDESRHCVPVLPELCLDLRLPHRFGALPGYGALGAPEAALVVCRDEYSLALRNLPPYTVAVLTEEKDGV